MLLGCAKRLASDFVVQKGSLFGTRPVAIEKARHHQASLIFIEAF